MKLQKPKMVLFDFGDTLFADGQLQFLSAVEAVRMSADNPEVTTTEEMATLWEGIGARYQDCIRRTSQGYTADATMGSVFRNLFARTGLTYSISLRECESIFDRHIAPDRAPVKGIKSFLDTLNEYSIPTAVISNAGCSAETMAIAISEGLPNSKMKFVLTSSDFIFVKPATDLFEGAAKLAGVLPADCWYCGNDHVPDIEGSAGAGMLPIIIELAHKGGLTKKKWKEHTYYAVNDWSDMCEVFKSL